MKAWQYEPAQDLELKPGQRIRSLRREPGLVDRALHRATWSVLKAYLKLRQRLEVVGEENIPDAAPFLLVANHSSHLDALVLGAAVHWRLRGQMMALAAGDTFFTGPIISTLSAFLLNALPVWRGRCVHHDLETLRARLTEGRSIYALFPEGTRSRDGHLAPFKGGVGRLVAGTDVPVLPCHISGAFEAWPPTRSRPRAGRVTISIGEPVRFPDVENGRDGWNRVARELEARVRALAPPQVRAAQVPVQSKLDSTRGIRNPSRAR